MHISTNDLHCCKPARLLQLAPSGGRGSGRRGTEGGPQPDESGSVLEGVECGTVSTQIRVQHVSHLADHTCVVFGEGVVQALLLDSRTRVECDAAKRPLHACGHVAACHVHGYQLLPDVCQQSQHQAVKRYFPYSRGSPSCVLEAGLAAAAELMPRVGRTREAWCT